ncbi:unnamed protein product, partial [Ectocarpus sp. 6 AP-2014]
GWVAPSEGFVYRVPRHHHVDRTRYFFYLPQSQFGYVGDQELYSSFWSFYSFRFATLLLLRPYVYFLSAAQRPANLAFTCGLSTRSGGRRAYRRRAAHISAWQTRERPRNRQGYRSMRAGHQQRGSLIRFMTSTCQACAHGMWWFWWKRVGTIRFLSTFDAWDTKNIL